MTAPEYAAAVLFTRAASADTLTLTAAIYEAKRPRLAADGLLFLALVKTEASLRGLSEFLTPNLTERDSHADR